MLRALMAISCFVCWLPFLLLDPSKTLQAQTKQPCTTPNVIIRCDSCPNFNATSCGGCSLCTKLIPGDYITNGGFLACSGAGHNCSLGQSNCSMCTLPVRYDVETHCNSDDMNHLYQVDLCCMYWD